MIVYAESSAVAAWLLHEPPGETVRAILAAAERVVTSALTRVECARAVARRASEAQLDPDAVRGVLRMLTDTSATWGLLDVADPVLDRASASFPVEPVRTLDALHIATALEFHAALGALTVLSLDERVRANATALGMEVAP